MSLIKYNGKKVIIMICSNCNISCKHCYISYEGDRTPEELLEIVNNLKDSYQLELNGAEILTNLDYLPAFKLAGQQFLISNGKAIVDNPETIKRLKENDIRSISLSYHFEIQTKFSVISEYDLKEIIKKLQDAGIEVRLMTTINSDNYRMIEEMCDKTIELGARGIKFTNYISQGNALELDMNNKLRSDQKNTFFQKLENARKMYTPDELLIERCGTFGINPYAKNNNFECTAMRDSVVLTPDNNIYPCVFLAKPGYEIGRYEDGKINIQEGLIIDNEKCLTDEVCNNSYQYIYRRNRKGE